jgi:hypothetical protein
MEIAAAPALKALYRIIRNIDDHRGEPLVQMDFASKQSIFATDMASEGF